MIRSRDIPGVPRQGQKRGLPQRNQPAIVMQPQVHSAILRGVDAVVNAIRPTLGPLPRHVVLERTRRIDVPEFLDDAATIARRIIAIHPRTDDVGAMLIRHALWQMRKEAGDGCATMALLYQTLLREGIRYIAQDCNPMLLRASLERGRDAITAWLRQHARPLAGREAITGVAKSMCQGDAPLSEMLGEIFDIVGPDGLIVVEGWEKAGLEREYVQGTYWKLSGWLSRLFVSDLATKQVAFDDAALFISDFDIKDPTMLVPVLERCIQAKIKRLVIVAADMSDAAIGLLVSNHRAQSIEVFAVRTPKVQEMDRVAVIEDIAILTGGKPYYKAAYPSLDDFRVEDLGRARRVWATYDLFGIFGGKGDGRHIRKRMSELRTALRQAESDYVRNDLQARLGRLHGGTVILRMGAIHETEREARKATAERAIIALRQALIGGVVAGGGLALLQAQAALNALPICTPEDRAAQTMLQRALQAPLCAIAANAGYESEAVLGQVRSQTNEPIMGFDVRTGELACMHEAGILDSALVLQKALEIAVSGAAMALTTETIVHHRNPTESIEP